MIGSARGFSCILAITILVAIAGGASSNSGARQQKEAPEAIPAAAVNKARERGEVILAAAVDAAGGAALRKIESIELAVRKHASTAHGTVDADLGLWLTYPSQMRVEECTVQAWVKGGRPSQGPLLTGPGRMPTSGSGPITPMQTDERCIFTYAEGYNGTTGWKKTSKGTVDVRLDDVAQPNIDLFGALVLYRWAAEDRLEPTFLGKEVLHGRELLAIEVGLPTAKLRPYADLEVQVQGGKLKLYADPETNLLAGVSFREVSAEGTSDVLQTWGDYRRALFKSAGRQEGIQFPFDWANYRNGKLTLEGKVIKLKLNSRLNPRIFARPK